MTLHLAVANRKGGVGKSTVSAMLAHGFSIWGGKRVLVVDIDSQCNVSVILCGGNTWRRARDAGKIISDYFAASFGDNPPSADTYVTSDVGDLTDAMGRHPHLDLVPGSLLLDDVQSDLFLKFASETHLKNATLGLPEIFEALLRRWSSNYDVVIFDCAPGLSFAAYAAIAVADRVIVPFRPDYVSLMAIDRVSLIIEKVKSLEQLASVPISKRRYVCLPNYVRLNGAERLLIEEVGLTHPLTSSQLCQRDGIAGAFDWMAQRRTIEEKYGDGVQDVRRLYEEIAAISTERRYVRRDQGHEHAFPAAGA
ncbi:MAG: ParA family protein [Hyphomicrobium sp.]|jgi:cellulose biosynthesis protein BcsQ